MPPPHDLDLVIDFVNTLDMERGEDSLTTPGALAQWLSGRDLLAAGAAVSKAEHGAALGLREALRALMLANNGGDPATGAWAALEDVARRGELAVAFEPGEVLLAARAPAVRGALAGLLVPVAVSLADRTWERAKACRSPTCQWAFYDRSRNRSGAWCAMAVCGNRTKVRSYRARTAAARTP